MLSLSRTTPLSFLRPLATVRFHGKEMDVKVNGKVGETIAQIAERNKIPLPMACEGSGACGTCHVYVKKGMKFLNEPSDREQDTLDFAPQLRDESRLGCQCVLERDGEIDIELPLHSRNLV